MMKISTKFFFSILCACLLSGLMISPALAFPPLPSSFYGAVTSGDETLHLEGLPVRALINGQVFAETRIELFEGSPVYSLDIPGDDDSTETVDGGKKGDKVNFEIDGVVIDQTAEWTSGVFQNVNLNVPGKQGGAQTESQATPIPTNTPIGSSVSPQIPVTSIEENENSGPAENPTASNTPVVVAAGAAGALLLVGILAWSLSRKGK
jgi:hypothetical protein